jgi:septum formation protein
MSVSYINATNPLILASASPRRRQLLHQIGLPFRAVASAIVEEKNIEEPAETACFLAERKAVDVSSHAPLHWILGADTLVFIDREVLGKPRDRADAGRMLQLLSGRRHSVVTGFCILNPLGSKSHVEAVITEVCFRNLDIAEIDDYIGTGEPFGKAGGYAIQGIGSFMVESITGSYTNVVGLPLCNLIRSLVDLGSLQRFPII